MTLCDLNTAEELKHVGGPPVEQVAAAILRRTLAGDVFEAKGSFLTAGGMTKLLALMRCGTQFVRQSAGAVLGSLTERGGWAAVANSGTAPTLFETIVGMVSGLGFRV